MNKYISTLEFQGRFCAPLFQADCVGGRKSESDLTDELLTDGRLIFYMLGAFINCWLFMDGISIAHECRNYWLFYKENRLTADRQTHSNFINIDINFLRNMRKTP